MLKELKNDIGAAYIVSLLASWGFSSYLVGGCVRDACMGAAASDIDITSSARPDQTAEILERGGCRVIATGLKHGTVTAVYNGVPYEITTMRTEDGYCDNRHPDKVNFVDNIKEDLKRRDFTVNAMAYSYDEDGIIDLYGGRQDIEDKLIRCVGEPQRRFEEDALRILRGLRFASRLGFDIEDKTLEAMRDKKQLLLKISAERIYKELCMLLCGKYAGNTVLKYSDILYPIIPELEACRGFDQHSKYHRYDVLEHICHVIDAVKPEPSYRLCALFHDIGKPCVFSLGEDGEGHFYSHAQKSAEIAQATLDKLKADTKTKEEAVFLVRHHDTPLPKKANDIKKRLNRIGIERFFALCDIAYADCMGQAEQVRYRLGDIAQIKKFAEDIISAGECFDASSLNINGYDIISLGVSEGKEVGNILKVLLDEVLCGKLENAHEKLSMRAKELTKRLE